jgi:hypothetical protein
LTVIFSTFALIVALATLYFQFFYKTHEIRISVINTNINFSVPEIETKIVYHNAGDLYTTGEFRTEFFTILFYQTAYRIASKLKG